ncbi:MAG: LLM class flavin-dependent oxidoreductase [Pseudomonadales bacterium]|nr:LLM class flavin-dependent oxidoreductase [Pseudomonadales bacterium]
MYASYWERIARSLERGCFDMLFFADTYTLHDQYKNSPDAAICYAVQYPRLDPLALAPMLSRVAPNLGFGVTASTTFLPPYWLARNMATMDHLTEGRIAWNVVTSYSRSEAQNFGMDDIPEHDFRYDMADEYMEVVINYGVVGKKMRLLWTVKRASMQIPIKYIALITKENFSKVGGHSVYPAPPRENQLLSRPVPLYGV